MDQSQYEELENLIDKLVSVNGYPNDHKTIHSLKVDLLKTFLFSGSLFVTYALFLCN